MTTRKPASTVTRLHPSVKLFVLDTNVLMHDPTCLFRFQEHDIYIPMATLEELDALLGRRVSRIHVVGGGVKNALLCQMIADATDRPVLAGPVEATAIGNLLVQLLARDGSVDLRGVRAVVRDSFEINRFEPREPGHWAARLAEAARAGGRRN